MLCGVAAVWCGGSPVLRAAVAVDTADAPAGVAPAGVAPVGVAPVGVAAVPADLIVVFAPPPKSCCCQHCCIHCCITPRWQFPCLLHHNFPQPSSTLSPLQYVTTSSTIF